MYETLLIYSFKRILVLIKGGIKQNIKIILKINIIF